jgi:hypothetical protein
MQTLASRMRRFIFKVKRKCFSGTWNAFAQSWLNWIGLIKRNDSVPSRHSLYPSDYRSTFDQSVRWPIKEVIHPNCPDLAVAVVS